ncbi:Phd Finger Protein 1 [Manis pentadactyla]|nr:Phd Finger Protein 1 [Manis pentadactyla]
MHRIRLRRELGFNSDLSARGECAIQFQDDSEAIVVSMVILEFQATGRWLAESCLRYGMTDIEADGVGSGQIDLDHHGVALVTSMLTLRIQLKGSCLGGKFEVEVQDYGAIDASYVERTGDVNADAECVQVKGPWLVVGFSVRLSFMFWCGIEH